MKTPLSLQRLLHYLLLVVVHGADLGGDHGALPARLELRHQLGRLGADLVGDDVTELLRHLYDSVHLFLVTLLKTECIVNIKSSN